MKEIPLTQNQIALVDDADFEWLNQWKWCAWWNTHTQTFYAVRGVQHGNYRIHVRMHRQILGLEYGDKRQGDHKNHNTLDNQRENLRIVTNQQNQFNRRNAKGYSWHKAARKYVASIRINYQSVHLGLFDTPERARQAYLDAKAAHYKMPA